MIQVRRRGEMLDAHRHTGPDLVQRANRWRGALVPDFDQLFTHRLIHEHHTNVIETELQEGSPTPPTRLFDFALLVRQELVFSFRDFRFLLGRQQLGGELSDRGGVGVTTLRCEVQPFRSLHWVRHAAVLS